MISMPCHAITAILTPTNRHSFVAIINILIYPIKSDEGIKMFCSQCGTNLEANAKFCSMCGCFVRKDDASEITTIANNSTPLVALTTEYSKPIGTKWLKFWNYISLPVGSILNLFLGYLMLLNFPIVGIIFLFLS